MKKSQTVQWHITFTDNITNEIHPIVMYICKYTDENYFFSVYTEGVTKGIIMRLKKGKSYGDMVFYW